MVQEHDSDPRWNKTVVAARRLGINAKTSSSYHGRFVIARDSPINGGICVGSHPREAIVVDDTEQPKLNQAYIDFVAEHKKAARAAGHTFQKTILRAIYEYSIKRIPDDDRVMDRVLKNYKNADNDGDVPLEAFIDEGGCCRHHALFAGYLLERLHKAGAIAGNVSVDRNSIGNDGHAWVRYTNREGTVMIIDPSQHYIGYLKERDNRLWWYGRPDDCS